MGRLSDSYAGCMECGGKMKKGGWIQSAIKNPGRCTPGSPNYDCPKGSPQWNLAQRFKSGDLSKKGQDGMLMTPENQMAPTAMRMGGRLYAQAGMMSSEDEYGSMPKVQAVDPNNVQAKAMLKEANADLNKANVKDYQTMLNKKYNAGLKEDGAWGKNTQAAYEKYIDSRRTVKSKGFVGPTQSPLQSLVPTTKTPQPSYLPVRNTNNFTGGNYYTPPEGLGKIKGPSVPGFKTPTELTAAMPRKSTANPDMRQLPQTGIVVDKGTNQTFVLGSKKQYSFPVLTGANPDVNADTNLGSTADTNEKKGKVTPRGYYIMDQNDVSESGKKEYKGNARVLTPISAYGTKAPKASRVAMHQTYDPAYRNQFYKQGPEQRRQSYGCVNGKCGDIKRAFRDVADKDTVMIIDSRLSQDRNLFAKAKARLKKP